MEIEELEKLRGNRVVKKLVEWDEKYNYTDLILGGLAGLGIGVLLVYCFPDLFPGVEVGKENVVQYVGEKYVVENLDNVLNNSVRG